MNLISKAKSLPSSPGIYLMKDSCGSIIYVGKSKNLKMRVQSYFQSSRNLSPKTAKLVRHLKDFDYIITDTEFEAFLLECKLIKDLKPLYNKLMKSPESYSYVSVRMDRKHDRLGTASSFNKEDHYLYFGPFSNKNRVEKALHGLKNFLKINCNSVSDSTPCLNYSLGLCLGMCFQSTKLEEYHQIIDRITSLFQETDLCILDEMEDEMNNAAANFNFEKAAELRDTMEALKSLLRKEKVVQFTKDNRNIILMEAIKPNSFKLFIIKRNNAVFNTMLEVNRENVNETINKIQKKILHLLRKNNLSSTQVKKEEIDESQIIYNYLKKDTCSYAFIPEPLLESKNLYKLKNMIKDLLEKEVIRSSELNSARKNR